ncbi:MAG: hypothetical protein HFJ20_07860 [Clostridia bacterium]|nr:hypothetical protein [Clostridia bacterium]
MAKAKKGRKKQKKVNLDVAVVVMIVISILLAVLIYTESRIYWRTFKSNAWRDFWFY